MNTAPKSALARFSPLLVLLIFLLPLLIYQPGVHGPFIFDDIPNFIINESVHMDELSLEHLREAANSNQSGILGRPIAAITFALNYYFAGGMEHDTFAFKIFNILVHSLNGLLIFWFLLLVFRRLHEHPSRPLAPLGYPAQLTVLAAACALMWVVHPIHLTSVLYVVQRMTSLAALFILLALIFYLQARLAWLQGKTRKSLLWLAPVPLWGLLAALSKETGLLIPLYIIILELVLFVGTRPWNLWNELGNKTRMPLLATLVLVLSLLFTAAVLYSLPGYQNRDFSLSERLLTEGRVLVFYIGQILIPRLSSFGIYHDDIVTSHNLFQPWTTLPSIIVVMTLLFSAFLLRRRYPLYAFAILWFFVGHALESTVYPLELVHEHRNYLASLGIILIIIQAILWLYREYKNRRIWLLAPLFIIILSATTAVRSHQWKDIQTLLEAQVWNHPESARAWAELSGLQHIRNMHEQALVSITRASLLEPDEPGYLVTMQLYMNILGMPVPESLIKKTEQAIRKKPRSQILALLLYKMSKCMDSSCPEVIPAMERWLRILLESKESARYYFFLGSNLAVQGKYTEALQHLEKSTQLEPEQITPYLTRIDIYLLQGKLDLAKATWNQIKTLSLHKYGFVDKYVIEAGERISASEKQASHTQTP